MVIVQGGTAAGRVENRIALLASALVECGILGKASLIECFLLDFLYSRGHGASPESTLRGGRKVYKTNENVRVYGV